MNDTDNIYFSLDAARAELARRWADVELRRRIETELGDNFVAEFRERPRGAIGRQLVSPDNALVLFVLLANYVGAKPFAWEFLGDAFSSGNNEKAGLGRLRVKEKTVPGKSSSFFRLRPIIGSRFPM